MRDALDYGASCIQPGGFNPPITETDEDCLYLNVYTPPSKDRSNQHFKTANKSNPNKGGGAGAGSSSSKLAPVLVWFHGGSYLQGGGNEERLNGTYLVEVSGCHRTPHAACLVWLSAPPQCHFLSLSLS